MVCTIPRRVKISWVVTFGVCVLGAVLLLERRAMKLKEKQYEEALAERLRAHQQLSDQVERLKHNHFKVRQQKDMLASRVRELQQKQRKPPPRNKRNPNANPNSNANRNSNPNPKPKHKPKPNSNGKAKPNSNKPGANRKAQSKQNRNRSPPKPNQGAKNRNLSPQKPNQGAKNRNRSPPKSNHGAKNRNRPPKANHGSPSPSPDLDPLALVKEYKSGADANDVESDADTWPEAEANAPRGGDRALNPGGDEGASWPNDEEELLEGDPEGDEGRPNVLILVANQQRWDEISNGEPNRQQMCSTPNIDRLLRKRGILFSNTIAASPRTVPAAAALATGFTPETNGHKTNKDYTNNATLRVPTLYHFLKSNGYHTAHFGQWRIDNSALADSFVTGKDITSVKKEYLGFLRERFRIKALQQIPNNVLVEGKAKYFGGSGFTGLSEPQRIGRLLVDDTVAELKRRTDEARRLREQGRKPNPFSITLNFFEPKPPKYLALEKYYQGQLPSPPNFRNRGKTFPYPWDNKTLLENINRVRTLGGLHCALLAEIDANVGRVLQALKTLKLEQNTLVIYTATRGHLLGHHNGLGVGPSSSVLFDEAVRVPLIMRYPGHIPANTTVTTAVSALDVAPTIVDYCLRKSAPGLHRRMHGQSLRLALRGGSKARRSQKVAEGSDIRFRDFAASHHNNHYMIKTTRWKLLYFQAKKIAFYDLAVDATEKRNLVHGVCQVEEVYARPLANLLHRLTQWLSYTKSKVKVRPLPKCKLGKSVSQRLRSLVKESEGAPKSAWWNQKLMKIEDGSGSTE